MKEIKITIPVGDEFKTDGGCDGCPFLDVDAVIIEKRFVQCEMHCAFEHITGVSCRLAYGEEVDA